MGVVRVQGLVMVVVILGLFWLPQQQALGKLVKIDLLAFSIVPYMCMCVHLYACI